MSVRKTAKVVAGIVCVPIGCLTMVSPIPGGSLVLPAGIAILIYESPFVRGCIRGARKKMPRVNELMIWTESKVGTRIGGIFMMTRPQENEPDSTRAERLSQ